MLQRSPKPDRALDAGVVDRFHSTAKDPMLKQLITKAPDRGFALQDGITAMRRVPGIVTRFVCPEYAIATRDRYVLRGSPDLTGWTVLTRVPGPRFPIGRFSERFFRRGIRAFQWCRSGAFLAFCDGAKWYWQPGDRAPRKVGTVQVGHGPLIQGVCEHPDGTLYYGEYVGFPRKKRTIAIKCWRPEWAEWRTFFEFGHGEARHIHGVQYDPFSANIWLATGDAASECLIGYFEQSRGIPELVTIGRGSVPFRAVSLIFTEQYVYWGTDFGKDTRENHNYIYRWCRRTGAVEQQAVIGAPVFYSTADADGGLWCTTGVEGSPSESDHYARLWRSLDGRNWSEAARWRKDRYPNILGYGLLSFPQGVAPSRTMYVNTACLEGSLSTCILTLANTQSHSDAA